MSDAPRQPDILYRLRFYADHVDDVPVAELEAIMREAAEDIKILRDLVGVKNDILLEDMPPEGNA